MHAYRSPPNNTERGGTTNAKNNRNIIVALSSGAKVEIFALFALATQHHGEFPVNLAAGLEDSLIQALAPPWNGRSANKSSSPASTALESGGPELRHEPKYLPGIANPALRCIETLFAFARQMHGKTMATTARRTPFNVEVNGCFLEFIPGSSKAPRREGEASITALLARLSETMSFQTSTYQDISFNASYVLALVKTWQHAQIDS